MVMQLSISKYKEDDFIDPARANEQGVKGVVDPLKKMIGSLSAEHGLKALRDELLQTIEGDAEEVNRAKKQLSYLKEKLPQKEEVMKEFSDLREILREKKDLTSMRSALREFKGAPKAKQILQEIVAEILTIESKLEKKPNEEQHEEREKELEKLRENLSDFLSGEGNLAETGYQKILSDYQEEMTILEETIANAPEGLAEKRKKIALVHSKISRIEKLMREKNEAFYVVSLKNVDKKGNEILMADISAAIEKSVLSEDEQHLLVSITEMLDFKNNYGVENFDVHILLTYKELTFFGKIIGLPEITNEKCHVCHSQKNEANADNGLIEKFNDILNERDIAENLKNLYQQKRTEKGWRRYAQSLNIRVGHIKEIRDEQLRELTHVFEKIKDNSTTSAKDKKKILYGLFSKIMQDIKKNEPGNVFRSRLYELCEEWRERLKLADVDENRMIEKYNAYKSELSSGGPSPGLKS